MLDTNDIETLFTQLVNVNNRLRNTKDYFLIYGYQKEKEEILNKLNDMADKRLSELKQTSWTETQPDGRIIKIIKEPDDPICLRASLGGTAKSGYYIVYRGDPEQIETMLTEVLESFRTFKKDLT